MIVFPKINGLHDKETYTYTVPSRIRTNNLPGLEPTFIHWTVFMCGCANICIIYHWNSGHFTTSENEWNRRNTTKLVFPSLCPLKSRGKDFKDGFQIFQFSWILLVPKHSLLKYFTLTFTRHKSSKFEGSGPPLTQICMNSVGHHSSTVLFVSEERSAFISLDALE